MEILKKVFVLFLFCFIGDIISEFLPFPFPGSVLAMILLFVCLTCGVIKSPQVEPVSDFLLNNMSLTLVPPTVSIISYIGTLRDILWQFFFICIVTTVITFVLTAYSVKLTIYLLNKLKGDEKNA
ncbi:MAG: CidA/LrgA family protein [Clostridia bacterium]|nr:CidA/LrgA family protein [Clostridia bacterium]